MFALRICVAPAIGLRFFCSAPVKRRDQRVSLLCDRRDTVEVKQLHAGHAVCRSARTKEKISHCQRAKQAAARLVVFLQISVHTWAGHVTENIYIRTSAADQKVHVGRPRD